jgi:hypothetical protein
LFRVTAGFYWAIHNHRGTQEPRAKTHNLNTSRLFPIARVLEKWIQGWKGKNVITKGEGRKFVAGGMEGCRRQDERLQVTEWTWVKIRK